jgi:hypothetical protein
VPSLEQMMYDVAVRSLDEQRSALDELRARTGTLLTAASLIASFLGAVAIDRSGLSAWVIGALLAFGVSVTLSIYVLLPKAGLIFALDAPVTYAALYPLRDDEHEVHRRLASWLQTFRGRNGRSIRWLTRAFGLAGFALLVEIALLSIGLALD